MSHKFCYSYNQCLTSFDFAPGNFFVEWGLFVALLYTFFSYDRGCKIPHGQLSVLFDYMMGQMITIQNISSLGEDAEGI